ncbi:hypothetical protein [Janthinobacterium sp. PC23-8]|uniref:hypothetical protein n=1 Tax=Janthinobacterium sp. PC23-8 TaxID=2012679 RepID=UPI000B9791D8|nr:hypothetical protein [Janthinobacterium sp. PC23-8]OYO29804.1 hypothetical protein CD932_00615 [Janthinobacterium sp. PC23-8]
MKAVSLEAIRLLRLERMLQPFIAPTSGLFLYFAAKTQGQPKLRALIDMATAQLRQGILGLTSTCPSP